MYYILLVTAALLYSLSFYFNRNVEKNCNDGINTAILFSAVTWIETLVILLVFIKGDIQFAPFSLLCAVFHSLFLVLFAFLNLKALAVADLSEYSMFTMLGGMLVPFFFGIAFFHEGITPGKIICCILVAIALYIDSHGEKARRKALLYLIAVFFVNGSFGVITAIHQNSNQIHVDTLQYMCMQAVIISIFGCAWLLFKKIKYKKINAINNKKAYLNMLLYGLVNGGAELILLFAIKHVPASVQYPVVTGGVIIFSTVISMLIGENKGLKKLIPVGITFAGLLCLL